jgi:hypothetical protein
LLGLQQEHQARSLGSQAVQQHSPEPVAQWVAVQSEHLVQQQLVQPLVSPMGSAPKCLKLQSESVLRLPNESQSVKQTAWQLVLTQRSA